MEVIAEVKAWLEKVVIGNNFCPFAAKPFLKDMISYVIVEDATQEGIITVLMQQLKWMLSDESVETVLLISPNGPFEFLDYLKIYERAVEEMNHQGYDGVFQLASFHPEYQFADAPKDDASNYTNRSPYPIFHILREDSVTKAIDLHPNVHSVPADNISFCREKGVDWLREQLDTLL